MIETQIEIATPPAIVRQIVGIEPSEKSIHNFQLRC